MLNFRDLVTAFVMGLILILFGLTPRLFERIAQRLEDFNHLLASMFQYPFRPGPFRFGRQFPPSEQFRQPTWLAV